MRIPRTPALHLQTPAFTAAEGCPSLPGPAFPRATTCRRFASAFVSPAGDRGNAFCTAASLTVECALSFPLFAFAVLSLILLLSLFGQYGETALTLSNTARSTAVYASLAGDAAPEWIDLTDHVDLDFPFFPGLRHLSFPVRARVRSYTGFSEDALTVGEEDSQSASLCYLTEYESVYHTHADCTHLDLSVRLSDTGSVASLRNDYGERYRPCDGFPAGYQGEVYVTAKGDRYYPSPGYAGLTRHVRAVSAEDCSGLSLCARCAARDESSP